MSFATSVLRPDHHIRKSNVDATGDDNGSRTGVGN